MRDPKLIELKRLAEIDPRLSDGAMRVLSLIVTEAYSDPHFLLDSARRLPWTWFNRIMGLCRDQFYGRMRELVFLQYLKPGPLKGCPPERSYFLTFKGRLLPSLKRLEKPSLDYRQNQLIKGREIRSNKGRQNAAPPSKMLPSGRNEHKAGSAAQSAGVGNEPASPGRKLAAGAARNEAGAPARLNWHAAVEHEAAAHRKGKG